MSITSTDPSECVKRGREKDEYIHLKNIRSRRKIKKKDTTKHKQKQQNLKMGEINKHKKTKKFGVRREDVTSGIRLSRKEKKTGTAKHK